MKKQLILLFMILAALGSRAQPKGAILALAEEKYSFDTLAYGAPCTHDFVFTNTGTEPLIISNASTSCGCDVPSWDKTPVKPGQKGRVNYRYDSTRIGPFVKTMTVQGNFEGGTRVIQIRGYVKAPKE